MLGETDGIVELSFDDIEGFKAFGNSKSYLEVIRPDEERFRLRSKTATGLVRSLARLLS